METVRGIWRHWRIALLVLSLAAISLVAQHTFSAPDNAQVDVCPFVNEHAGEPLPAVVQTAGDSQSPLSAMA